ncbi:MAG: hypothetical protein L0Z68_05990 [Gammaproteobacteria bacterium]|nr:hypothetical protein [Gammaproteobacteria bacterium]
MSGLIILLILGTYALAVILVSKLAYRLTHRKWVKHSTIIVAIAIPVASALQFFLPGYLTLRALCQSNQRFIINSTAHVNGFLFGSIDGASCGEGWDLLLEHSYKYVECTTAKFSNNRFQAGGDVYILTIEDAGFPGCQNVYRSFLSSKMKYERAYKNKLSGKCLSVVQTNDFKSRYVNIFESGYVDSSGNHKTIRLKDYSKIKGLITFYGTRTIDLFTNDTLSKSRNYKFYPGSIEHEFIPSVACGKERYIEINQVLILNK